MIVDGKLMVVVQDGAPQTDVPQPEKEINLMDRIREVMTDGTAFQPAFMNKDSEEKETNIPGDARNVIDSKEFPMNHGQFCAWFRRHQRDFEGQSAIIADHIEALEMNELISQEPEKGIDAFLAELHTTLKDFMLRAEKHENAAYADDLFAENDTAEQWTTIAKDLTRALGNVQWSIDYRHTCSFQREVGMSGCSYGCKIYRCETCGTDKEIHNATYGCRS
jgi:hypothetical protein